MPTKHESARILVVDETPATLQLLTAYLVSDGHDVATARCEVEFSEHIRREVPDVLIVDMLTRPDRTQFCRRITELADGRGAPMIVSADAGTLLHRSRLHQAGADDFVSKPYQRTELLLRVGAMLRLRSLTGKLREKTVELRSAKALLRKQAITDALTGLFNNRHFEALLDREIERAERRSGSLAAIAVSLDGLRRFNRGHGRQAGDRLLKRVGSLLRSQPGTEHLAARTGDKRFTLLLPGSTPETARQVAERLRRRLRLEVEGEGIAYSLVVASWPEHASDRQGLLRALESRPIGRDTRQLPPRLLNRRPSV